jgi:hypothetical protein
MPYTAQERAELVHLLCQAAPSPETTRTPVSIEPNPIAGGL